MQTKYSPFKNIPITLIKKWVKTVEDYEKEYMSPGVSSAKQNEIGARALGMLVSLMDLLREEYEL